MLRMRALARASLRKTRRALRCATAARFCERADAVSGSVRARVRVITLRLRALHALFVLPRADRIFLHDNMRISGKGGGS